MNKKIKLSPSSSHRWLKCPGSINAEKNYPQKKSKYALEGTIAHKLAEICLKNTKSPDKYLNKKIDDFFINEEMGNNIKKYIEFINKYKNENSKIFIEKKIMAEDKKFYVEGTLDCCIINKNICHIFDLKYGRGISVSSENNSQLNFYAIGMLNFLNENNIYCDIFQLHIVQPRINNYSSKFIYKKELIEIKTNYNKKCFLTTRKNAKRIPGDPQCRWCLAKNDCKELNNYLNKIVFKDFNKLDYSTKKITHFEKKKILDNYLMIKNYIESIKEEIYQKIKAGGQFFNYKIKKGGT